MSTNQPMGFVELIAKHRGGQLASHLTDQLTELVQSVERTEKPGEITLTLKIKPNKGALSLSPVVKSKRPETDIGETILWGDEHGHLHRSDPRQFDIEDELARRREH